MFAALAMAVGLALDTSAVTAARALAGRRSLALPWLFGACHAAMATLGWALGRQATAVIRDWDRWIAAGILFGLAARMFTAPPPEEAAPADRPWEIAVLAIATSVDALAAGLAIDALGVSPPIAIALIAGVCVALSTTATLVGAWAGRRLGRNLDRIGGVLLVLVAVRIVVAHS